MLHPLQKRKMIQQGPDSNLTEKCPLNRDVQGEFSQTLQVMCRYRAAPEVQSFHFGLALYEQ